MGRVLFCIELSQPSASVTSNESKRISSYQRRRLAEGRGGEASDEIRALCRGSLSIAPTSSLPAREQRSVETRDLVDYRKSAESRPSLVGSATASTWIRMPPSATVRLVTAGTESETDRRLVALASVQITFPAVESISIRTSPHQCDGQTDIQTSRSFFSRVLIIDSCCRISASSH